MVHVRELILVMLQASLNKKFIVPNKRMHTYANANITAFMYFTPLQY